MKLCFLALILVGIAIAEFQSIGYKACKSDGTVVEVKAEGCGLIEKNNKKVCVFKTGSKPNIQIHFKPAKPSATLKTSVRAKVGTASLVEFPQVNNDACTYGVKCPLPVGEIQVFQQEIEITEQHPKNEVIQVNWQLTGAEGVKEACVIFLAQIE